MKGKALGESVDAKACYLFLCGSFGQCIAVTKIIDFYVLDEVAVLLVRLAGDGGAWVQIGRLDGGRADGLGHVSGSRRECGCMRPTYRADWGHIDMLDALLRRDAGSDARSHGRRRRSSTRQLGGLVCTRARRAVCGATSYGTARATRLRLPA